MPLHYKTDRNKVFDIVENDEFKYEKESTFKLHICLNAIELSKNSLLKETLNDCLDEAVKQQIIRMYKVLRRVTMPEHLRDEPLVLRAFNLPYTLYLVDEFDRKNIIKVAFLINEIEKKLIKTSTGEKKKISFCDLELSPHITFRCAVLNNQYNLAEKNNEKQLEIAGRNSPHFQFLNFLLREIPNILVNFCKKQKIKMNKKEIEQIKTLVFNSILDLPKSWFVNIQNLQESCFANIHDWLIKSLSFKTITKPRLFCHPTSLKILQFKPYPLEDLECEATQIQFHDSPSKLTFENDEVEVKFHF